MNENINKVPVGRNTRKSLALLSFVLGGVSLFFLILVSFGWEPHTATPEFLEAILAIIMFFAPFFAIIYGIIALTEKEHKLFSLLGVIFGIIALLLIFNIVSNRATRPPPWGAELKSSLGGIRFGIRLCCAVPTNQLQTVAGSDICNPATEDFILPTYSDLLLFDEEDLVYAIVSQCDTETPTIVAIIKNHRKGAWQVPQNSDTFSESLIKV